MPTGTAVIRGRVISDTGTPVRRAQVRANVSGMPGGRVASTDTDGRFELRDLAAGQWTLSASKPGYVTQRLGQRRPFETVSPIQLTDGQRVDGANFALLRGGVISGRVQDDVGDPIANVRVRVQRSQMFEGRRRLIDAGVDDQTDDTGAFRLYGLAPGDYYVSATLRANFFESSDDATGYAATYYPGTGNVAEAQRVSVGAGEEMSIGFSLLPVRLVRVSGTVVELQRRCRRRRRVLTSAGDGGEGPLATHGRRRFKPDGSFTIANVAPGSYVLNARAGLRAVAADNGRGRGGVGAQRRRRDRHGIARRRRRRRHRRHDRPDARRVDRRHHRHRRHRADHLVEPARRRAPAAQHVRPGRERVARHAPPARFSCRRSTARSRFASTTCRRSGW